jgi:predicted nucleic acid-binding protein
MDAIVIDASVAVKWYLEEAGSGAAREILASKDRLVAPSFIFLEVQYVLSIAARKGRFDPAAIERAETTLLRRFDMLTPVEQLMIAAAKLSRSFDHPIYDCLYIELALAEGTRLATADARQAEMARQAGAKTLRVG